MRRRAQLMPQPDRQDTPEHSGRRSDWKPPNVIQGFKTRWTSRDFLVLELDYVADPAKDEAWAQQELNDSPSYKAFRREYLRDWESASGDTFYPEFDLFDEKKPSAIVIPARGVIRNKPIVRGWDFGRHAACIWLQYDDEADRVYVLRELMTEGLGADSFRDLVMFLSGQIGERELDHKALLWLGRLRKDKRYPPPPWFQPDGQPLRFLDFAGHEATQERAEVSSQTKEKSSKEILAAGGIMLHSPFVTVRARENVMRRLLKWRPDQYPGILFDPACPILIAGMKGGIAYPEGTKANPEPEEPKKDGYYDHLHDAAGYALVNTVPAVAPKGNPTARKGRDEMVVTGDRRIVSRSQLEAARGEFMETRKPRFPIRQSQPDPHDPWASRSARRRGPGRKSLRGIGARFPFRKLGGGFNP